LRNFRPTGEQDMVKAFSPVGCLLFVSVLHV